MFSVVVGPVEFSANYMATFGANEVIAKPHLKIFKAWSNTPE